MERRGFLKSAGTAVLASGAAGPALGAPSGAASTPRAVKPGRLRSGDVAGLVAPAGASLGVGRHRDRPGGRPGLRPRAPPGHARPRSPRLLRREGRGPRRRPEPLLRRHVGEGRLRDPGRLGRCARPALPRLGDDPSQPEGPHGLQRRHRPALRPAGEGRPRDLPRAGAALELAAVLGRALQAGGVRGGGRDDGQPARQPGSARPAGRTALARSRRARRAGASSAAI